MNAVELIDIRRKGIRLLAAGGWVSAAVIGLLSWMMRLPDGIAVFAMAATINFLPTLMAWTGRSDANARIVTGVMAATHPALFVYLLQGHPWQMDLHMYFFVALSALAILCDWVPIAVAAGLIAVHHLLLEMIAPAWVFDGDSNLDRVMIHALAVVLQFSVLTILTRQLSALVIHHAQSKMLSDELAACAEEEQAKAEYARHEAEIALAAVKAAEQRASEERLIRARAEADLAEAKQRELMMIASEFEQSVSSMIDTIVLAAAQLDDTSQELNSLSEETGRKVGMIVMTAADAFQGAEGVNDGISALLEATSRIALNAGDQAKLTAEVQKKSTSGNEMIGILAGQTSKVDSFVGLIQQIASRTDLLALNAAIEASRAGDAGKGFAVVAAEVKSLSAQVAAAAAQISDLIAVIQSGADMAGTAVGDVSVSIDQLAHAAGRIATVTAEQDGAVIRMRTGIADMARHVKSVSDGLGNVAEAVDATDMASDRVRSEAGRLRQGADLLKSVSDAFVGKLRAA